MTRFFQLPEKFQFAVQLSTHAVGAVAHIGPYSAEPQSTICRWAKQKNAPDGIIESILVIIGD